MSESAAAQAIPEAPPTEARSYIATSVVGPVVGKVGLNQLMFFFRQLGTMIEAGVPIVQTLDTLSRQSRDPRPTRPPAPANMPLKYPV